MAIQDFKTRIDLLAETPLLRYPALVGDKLNYDREKVEQFVQLTGDKFKDEFMVHLLLALKKYLDETPEDEIDYEFLEEKFPFIAREVHVSAQMVNKIILDYNESPAWLPFKPPNIDDTQAAS